MNKFYKTYGHRPTIHQIPGYATTWVHDYYKGFYDEKWKSIISVFHWLMIREQFVVFNGKDEVKHFIGFIPFYFFF
jgi:hypothetical protein